MNTEMRKDVFSFKATIRAKMMVGRNNLVAYFLFDVIRGAAVSVVCCRCFNVSF